MAANQTFPGGPGKPQESQGTRLPPSAASLGSLPDRQGCDGDMWHVVFRAFTSSEDSDPVQDLQKLSELCRLWLRPDLHTTEQILDKLVLEQFMISMPLELQVLVKDHNVQSCKDLEDILRRKEEPKTCTVVSVEGQKFLLQNLNVQMAKVEVGDENTVLNLSTKSRSFVCEAEVHAEDGREVSQEPENQPEVTAVSTEETVVSVEGQKFLLQNSNVQMAKVEVGDENPVLNLSTKSRSFVCEVEVHAEDGGEVSQEPENQPEVTALSTEEGQTALPPETTAEEGDLEGVRPTEMLEELPVGDQGGATVPIPAEPRLPRGPEVSVGMQSEENPPEGTGPEHIGADADSTQGPDTDVLPLLRQKRKDSQGARGAPRRKRLHTPTPQAAWEEGAVQLDERIFSRPRGSRSVPTPSTSGAPVRKSARRPKPCECADCKKTFSYESQLAIHQRKHTGERPYECELCHKKFIQPSDLRVHQRVHTGEKPYVCQTCGKAFAHESTLRGHRKVHTREKPYSCSLCKRSFSHKGNLNVHLRTHTGLRPYVCPECGQTFRQVGTLKRHQKIHASGTSPGSQRPSA